MIKTYKRETAIAMLCSLAALCSYGLGAGDKEAIEWAKLFCAPIFLFAGGAFGLDAAAKQWPKKSGTSREYG